MNIHGIGKSENQIKGGIKFSCLKAYNGTPVNIRFKRQICLSDFLALTDFFEMQPKGNSLFGVFEYNASLSVYHISKVRYIEKRKDVRGASYLYSCI